MFLSAFFALTLYFFIKFFTSRRAKRKTFRLVRKFLNIGWKEHQISADDLEEVVENTLNSLNVVYSKETDEDGDRTYSFDYQDGLFYLSIDSVAERGMRLIFPGFASTPLDNIDSMRIMCNETNSRSSFVQAAYSIKQEENETVAHLTARLPPTTDNTAFAREFQLAARDCFVLRKIASDRLDYLVRTAHEMQTSDLEYSNACSENTETLLHNIELMQHDPQSGQWLMHNVAKSQLSVKSILRFIHPSPTGRIISLEAHAGDYTFSSTEESDILNYLIATPILGGTWEEGEAVEFKNKRATINLTLELFTQEEETEEKEAGAELTICLMLEAVKQTKDALLFRLTYCLPQHVAGRSVSSSPLEAAHQPLTGSLLLSYDLQDNSKKNAEFRYMWGEAQDKFAEQKVDECTPEQRLIGELSNPSVAFNLYWGHRFLREELFVEAAIRLERAEITLREEFRKLKKKERGKYYRVCYLLGLCYMKLNMYKEAYYYLNIAEDESNTDYIQAKIDCVIALKDVRAMKILKNMIDPLRERIQQSQAEEEEVPEYVMDLFNFLRRREVFLNIEYGYLNEAEKLCKEMLEEPANADYALSELAHLQKLRAEGAKSIPPSIEDMDFPF